MARVCDPEGKGDVGWDSHVTVLSRAVTSRRRPELGGRKRVRTTMSGCTPGCWAR